jgi:hypothetical protein
MSGVGKSIVAARLSELGFKAVDVDHEGFSLVDERGDQHWDVDRLRRLMATEDAEVLFVVGADDVRHLTFRERSGHQQRPVGYSIDALRPKRYAFAPVPPPSHARNL